MLMKEKNRLKKVRKIVKYNTIFYKLKFKKFQIKSIRTKLILSFSIPIILIISLGIITYSIASSVIIENYKTSATQTIDANGNYLELIFDNIEAKSNQIISNGNVTKYYGGGYEKNSIEEFAAYDGTYNDLIAMAAADKSIYSINIISTENEPISTYANFTSNEYKDYMNSAEALQFDETGNKLIWSGYHDFLDDILEIPKNQYSMSLTRQLFRTKGNKLLGYVIMDVNSESIKELLNTIDFGDRSCVAFVSGDGRIHAKATAEEKIASIADEVYNENFFSEILLNDLVSGSTDVSYNSEKYLFVYRKIGSTGSVLYTMIPEAIILNQVSNIKVITIGIVILAVIIALLVCTIISTGISNTIKHIISGVNRASRGDLTVTFETNRKDDLELLINSLSEMIISMKKLIEKTVQVSLAVKGSAQFVGATAGGFIKSSKDIAISLGDIEQGYYQQASDAENCLSMMDDLSMKIGDVSDSSQEIGIIANNTKDIVGSGMDTINALEERVSDTSNMARVLTDEIAHMQKDVSSIGDIIVMINYIADQTNLLSLNASIEAARAGQAGRGFAVVADEIRKLATQSIEAASKVDESISRINLRTNNMVEIAEKTSKVVGTQEKALSDTISIFKKIDNQVDNLVRFLHKISEGVSMVDEVKTNTLGSVESISSIIEEAAAVTSEVNSTAQKQMLMAEKLNEATKRLESDSNILEDAVEIFTI
ncbi:MAG TPA: methyl-accepting chemotaxis protein [Clostridiales bacterium]|nr:methyl-accepting chemotaxis protein [Clostridiales bacterium]